MGFGENLGGLAKNPRLRRGVSGGGFIRRFLFLHLVLDFGVELGGFRLGGGEFGGGQFVGEKIPLLRRMLMPVYCGKRKPDIRLPVVLRNALAHLTRMTEE